MNHLIEEQSQLKELEPLLLELSTQAGHVSVDTEFLREKTYKAKLCLVQLGIGENQYCIDVLAIADLSILTNFFSDQRVLKLFHAARQDMEVIYQTLGVLPEPIFDTQLAAAFCGSDMQIGYAGLVKERLDIDLAKTQARTDWTRRPLSEEQIDYAADDVKYLEHLYLQALADITEQGKLAWYQEEIKTFYELDKYIIDPALAYKRLSGGGLNLIQQYTLRALAEWRETMAQKKDIPRSWILKDDRLYELATKRPMTEDKVIAMEIFGRKSAHRNAPIAVNLIANVEVGDKPLWKRIDPFDKQDKSIISSMMKQLASYARDNKVAQGLLGTRRDVESFYRHSTSKKLLSGWRKEVVGNPLQEFVANKSA